MKIFKEFVNLGLENPVSNIKKPFDEAAYNDLKLNKVNAIYPVIVTLNKICLMKFCSCVFKLFPIDKYSPMVNNLPCFIQRRD
jgi:hypothetical protein